MVVAGKLPQMESGRTHDWRVQERSQRVFRYGAIQWQKPSCSKWLVGITAGSCHFEQAFSDDGGKTRRPT